MEIEYISIAKLMPYYRNPRKNDASVSAVAQSIKQFGFRNPIVIDRNGTIIAGHTRLKAARMLGLDKVPVIKADDLSEEQVAAFRLADNKAQELSSWDFSLLMDELTAIKGIDMEAFGFSYEEEERKDTHRKESRTSNLDDGYEIDIGNFSEEEFKCECPECGFKFNE